MKLTKEQLDAVDQLTELTKEYLGKAMDVIRGSGLNRIDGFRVHAQVFPEYTGSELSVTIGDILKSKSEDGIGVLHIFGGADSLNWRITNASMFDIDWVDTDECLVKP